MNKETKFKAWAAKNKNKKIYKFVGAHYVQAESMEEARAIFADESTQFAADVDCYEYYTLEEAYKHEVKL
jgi:hypothetical protein